MVANIKAGDKSLILAKNAKRNELIQLLHNLSNYVLFTAAGNATVAGSAGFPFAKTPEPMHITVPENLKAVMGYNKGTVKVSIDRVKGARSYVFQYTTDPTMAEGSWITHYCTNTKCLLQNLASGVTVYIRVAAVGANEQTFFTAPISCIPQ